MDSVGAVPMVHHGSRSRPCAERTYCLSGAARLARADRVPGYRGPKWSDVVPAEAVWCAPLARVGPVGAAHTSSSQRHHPSAEVAETGVPPTGRIPYRAFPRLTGSATMARGRVVRSLSPTRQVGGCVSGMGTLAPSQSSPAPTEEDTCSSDLQTRPAGS